MDHAPKIPLYRNRTIVIVEKVEINIVGFISPSGCLDDSSSQVFEVINISEILVIPHHFAEVIQGAFSSTTHSSNSDSAEFRCKIKFIKRAEPFHVAKGFGGIGMQTHRFIHLTQQKLSARGKFFVPGLCQSQRESIGRGLPVRTLHKQFTECKTKIRRPFRLDVFPGETFLQKRVRLVVGSTDDQRAS